MLKPDFKLIKMVAGLNILWYVILNTRYPRQLYSSSLIILILDILKTK